MISVHYFFCFNFSYILFITFQNFQCAIFIITFFFWGGGGGAGSIVQFFSHFLPNL